MIDPIAAYPGPMLANLAPVPQLDLPVAMVSAVDQARFDAALKPAADASAPATNVDVPAIAAINPEPAPAFAPVRTPGDMILAGIDRLRGNYELVSNEATALAQLGEVAPQALLAVQMEVAQMTLGTQLVTQVASKLEQNLNTLLKGS